ncbi:MAG: response regulator, partial [Gammaproteobacteria bacterium]|nr:response regulator [Gammaproteobacteria bacterium]
MASIRVLVADDSSSARTMISEMLRQGGLTVVGEARNGLEAVEMTAALKPDIITMDLEMPVMDGFDAIQEIMNLKAIPILVLSSIADAANGCRAISYGALEVLQKPTLSDGKILCDKVEMLAEVPVIRHIRRKTPTPPQKIEEIASPLPPRPSLSRAPLFVIASSTGGPSALEQIISSLPV